MPARLTLLVALAVVAIAAAVGLGLTGATGVPKKERTRSSAPAQEVRRPTDPVVSVAARYALAARNWTAATYLASWQRQISLAGGRYRRELSTAMPGSAELNQFREEGSRSKASLVSAERDPTVESPQARVIVTLRETTVANGQTIDGQTVNQVTLREIDGRWQVTGWTVIPGASR